MRFWIQHYWHDGYWHGGYWMEPPRPDDTSPITPIIPDPPEVLPPPVIVPADLFRFDSPPVPVPHFGEIRRYGDATISSEADEPPPSREGGYAPTPPTTHNRIH